MKVFEIKATLQRSNPQLIRVLAVPCNTTLRQLHKILQIVIGWRDSCEWEMKYGEIMVSGFDDDTVDTKRSIGTESELQDVIKQGSVMEYRFGDELRWLVRLQVNEMREEDSLTAPTVIRYRGDNLRSHTRNIREYNHEKQTINSNYLYRIRALNQDDSFQEEQINFELQMRFGETQFGKKITITADFVPDFSKAIPVRELFENETVDMLRYYAEHMNFPITSSVRKKQLIEALVMQYKGTNLLRRCLEEMSLQEYEFTRMLYHQVKVYATSSEWKQYSTLRKYYMINNNYNNAIVCTKEFLEGYQSLIREGYESVLYRRKKVEAVIYVGCHLYGAIEASGIKELLDKYYPDEYTADDIKKICKDVIRRKNLRFGYDRRGYFFDDKAISKQDIEPFLETISVIPRYIPEKEEYEQIESHGPTFENNGEELKKILTENIHMYSEWAEYYHAELYHILQMGSSADQAVGWFFNTVLERHDRKQEKMLRNWLEDHGKTVRKYILNGHTDEEMKALRKTEKQQEEPKKVRIFPNDPCPCGSGKKYKKCCGRR